jgi:pimeloyl-ACP methyl ester carboxylesterase
VSRGSFIEAGGYGIHVRQTGTGKPVLLIHGVGCSAGMWRPVEAAWPDLRLVSFDPPGMGRSPGRLNPPSILAHARLAEAVLDELELEQVDVVGYSMGGTVAQTLALLAPGRVRRVVLAATSPGWGSVPGRWRSMVHLYTPLRFMSRWYYENTIGMMAGGQARRDPAFVARHAAERLRERPSLVGYYSQVVAAASWTSIPWLDQIKARTLVVAGGDDPLLPAVNATMLARRIPNARLQVYPADGHLMLFDAESPAIADIHEFLQAPTEDLSETWNRAVVVTESDELEALRTTYWGMFPWGHASAVFRSFHSGDLECPVP